MEDNKDTAEVVDRKLIAIQYLDDMYGDSFTKDEYEIAVEIGNLDFFENEECEFIGGAFVCGSGNTLHNRFTIRDFEYLSHRRRLKEQICRS